MEESNSLVPTELFSEKKERVILGHCRELMEMSSAPVSSQHQYDALQEKKEECHGDAYTLQYDVEFQKERLAEAEAKLAFLNNAISESKKQEADNNLIFNGTIVSKYSSGQKRKENQKYPSKSQRKAIEKMKKQTGSEKSRKERERIERERKKGKKGGRTRRIKK